MLFDVISFVFVKFQLCRINNVTSLIMKENIYGIGIVVEGNNITLSINVAKKNNSAEIRYNFHLFRRANEHGV